MQMLKKRKEEYEQIKAQRHGKVAKKSMIFFKEVKKVMLTQKHVLIAYPSESSLSFQKFHSTCPQEFSLVSYEFQDVLQEPPKGLPNRPAYRTSPDEAKEIQKQMECKKGGCNIA